MPIKWRSLEETLNPQPVAFDVIRKLLQYIDSCDEASKSNLPPPRLCAEDGSPIFPPEGDEFELWWLTDAKRKEKGDEQSAGDVGLKSIASCLHLQELNLSELAMCMG